MKKQIKKLIEQDAVLKISATLRDHIGFLVALNPDAALEEFLIVIAFIDSVFVVEIDDTWWLEQRSTSHEIYLDTLQIALKLALRAEKQPCCHQAVIKSVEAVADWSSEVPCVIIGQVPEGVDTVFFAKASLAELYVQVRILRIVFTNCTEKLPLRHDFADCNPFCDAVEVHIDQIQIVILIVNLKDNMARAEIVRSTGAGAVYRTIMHGVDVRSNRGWQVNSVVEVPLISVDTRPERCVHLVRPCASTEGPNVSCHCFFSCNLVIFC